MTQDAEGRAGRADVVVVGGGILGVAVASELSERLPGRRIELLEKEPKLAAHQTGRNSGVIHSGLYYRPGSAKARHCTRGAARMVEFCARHEIAHRICGKLVVARHDRELPALTELHRRGGENGVAGLELLDHRQMVEVEPNVAGIRALWVPGSGIVDYVAVAETMARLATERGAVIHTGRALLGVNAGRDGLELDTSAGPLRTRYLVNCGGLHADRIARSSAGAVSLRIVPFRGEYYDLVESSRHLIRGLIYPVPDPSLPFLGVHFTTRVDGSVEAGPNAVLALHREGYSKSKVSLRDVADILSFPGFWRMASRNVGTGIAEVYRSFSKRAFVRDLQQLVPAVQASDLEPGGAGVRAQAVARDGQLLDDFAIVDGPRAIHVCNAPSPGATASLSIAEEIGDRVLKTFDLGPADRS